MNLKLNHWDKGIIANKKGNALPFVLIIGFVITILVGSLAAVAVSGINFTQKSVENRQAYLDAKSVVEFARIEINKDYEKTKADYTFSQDKSTFKRPVGGVLFYVFGDTRTGSGDVLNLRRVAVADSASATGVRLGRAVLVEDFNNPAPDVTDITLQYHYEITTDIENLDRQLNYKTGYSYTYQSNNGGGSGSATYPNRPDELKEPLKLPDLKVLQAGGMPKLSDAKSIKSPIAAVQFSWWDNLKPGGAGEDCFCTITPTGNRIEGTSNIVNGNKNWNLAVSKSGSDLKLTYTGLKENYTTLTVTAANIETTNLPSTHGCEYHINAVDTLYIDQPLVVEDGCKVYLNAKKIIVNGGISVNSGGLLYVGSDYCADGLYVGGDVNYSSGSNSIVNLINAKNIYINGSVKTPGTSLKIVEKNLWIEGSLILDSYNSGSSIIEQIPTENDGIVWIGADYIVGDSQNTIASVTAKSVYVNNSVISGDRGHPTSTINATNLIVLKSAGSTANAFSCSSPSNSIFNCQNVLFKGPITTSSANQSTPITLTFNQVHYFESATMNLGSGTNFTINGSTDKDNQFIVNGQVNHGGAGLFSINNMYWFGCNYLSFLSNSIIDVHAQVVMIKKDTNGNNGEMSLTHGMSPDKSIFDVQYLYVEGPTTIVGGSDAVTTFTNSTPPGKCDIIFAGGYFQKNATVNINNARNIIMQGNIDIGQGNAPARLDLKADQIYFDSDNITHGDWGKGHIAVAYGGIAQGTGTDFYIKSLIEWRDDKLSGESGGYDYVIGNGVYKSVVGASLRELNKAELYQGPVIPPFPYPGNSANTETGKVGEIKNSGIYY